MRRSSNWYVYPVLLALLGFGIFIAVQDLNVPTQTVEKEIPYDRLQK